MERGLRLKFPACQPLGETPNDVTRWSVVQAMSQAIERPTLSDLQRFPTLNELDPDALRDLAGRLTVGHARPGQVLLESGSIDDHTLFLLEGRIRLTADDGRSKVFDHQHPSARDPVARLRPSHYQVTAEGPVRYLEIAAAVMAESQTAHEASTLLDSSYQVEEGDEVSMGGLDANNRLMIKIYQDLNADALRLPTLPQIAARIGKAMRDPSLSAETLAKVITADPAVTAKLLRVANSPRYAGRAEITTLPNAIARIGLDATHSLVIAFAMQEVFKTGSGVLKQHMRAAWKHSRRVAAICHVLASRVNAGHLDPAFALLAGLLHDIGRVAVLGYARDCPELTRDETTLDQATGALSGQLGGAIVRAWQLPQALAGVTQWAHDFGRDHPEGKPDYADLVIVAELHCRLGNKTISGFPRIDQAPAYAKLGLGYLDPDSSLALLAEAQEEIRELEQLLGG